MRCSSAKKLISDYVDGDIDSQKNASFKSHLEGCLNCQKVLKDFQKITANTKKLEELSPSDQTWFKIATRLNAEEQTSKPLLPKRQDKFSYIFTPGGLRYAFAAAVLFVIVIGALLFGPQFLNRDSFRSEAESQQYLLAKLGEAERHYQLAIKSLWEAVSVQEKNVDPQVVEMFRNNLEIVDASIRTCREIVLSDPDNLESRNYLLAVYNEKVDLLTKMMTIQENSSPIRESDKIL